MNKNNPFQLFSQLEYTRRSQQYVLQSTALQKIKHHVQTNGNVLYRELLLYYLGATILLLTIAARIPLSPQGSMFLFMGILVVHFAAKVPVYRYLNRVRLRRYMSKIARISAILQEAAKSGKIQRMLDDLNDQAQYYETHYNQFHDQQLETSQMSFSDYSSYYKEYCAQVNKTRNLLKRIIAKHG